ncbi:MAG: TonB-dependent receptor domain-containing protein, partial [bacterium]
MRKIIGLKFILLFALAGMAFSQENRGVITGKIFDAASQKPIEYANVILFSQNDSAMVMGTASGENGGFHLDKIPPGAYYIDIQFIGFKKKKLGHIEIGPAKLEIDLGKILLQQTTLNLEGVEVQGEAMAMTYQIDKKVINVSQQQTAISGTAVDVLENVPAVTVDIEGNVSLRGSSNFTVLIDGRPSILEPSEALQQIPASTIENIEIVTNPSAKYDPEGAAGIINIILKKDLREGRSGLANLHAGIGDKYSGDLLYHHKNENYQASFGADYNRRFFTGNDREQNQTIREGLTSFIHSDGGSRRKDISLGLRSEIELELGRQEALNLGARFGRRDSQRGSALNYAEWSEAALDKLFYTGTSDRNRERHFYALSMSYQHRFAPKGHELAAEIFFSRREGDEATTNGLLTNDAVIVSGRRTTEAGPSRDLRARLDYTLALSEEAKFEAGYQSEFDHSEDRTGLYEYDPGQSGYVLLPQFSNRTRNDENVHALYAIYAGAWGRLGYQAGWRGEYMDRAIVFDDVPTRRDFTIGRWDYFPTLHLSHEFSAGQQAMASYTRRIERPDGGELEPYQTWIDAYNVRAGNPALKPEYIDSYELGYQTNIGESRLSAEAYYRKTHNRIEDVRSVYDDNITLHSVENIGKDFAFGSELALNVDFGKKWNANLTGNLYHYRI